ncbi:hypothetical protein JOD27_002236 [Lentzea nigeriaca]|nr:hypothetical protein [Lentzea nigeriaca]
MALLVVLVDEAVVVGAVVDEVSLVGVVVGVQWRPALGDT